MGRVVNRLHSDVEEIDHPGRVVLVGRYEGNTGTAQTMTWIIKMNTGVLEAYKAQSSFSLSPRRAVSAPRIGWYNIKPARCHRTNGLIDGISLG